MGRPASELDCCSFIRNVKKLYMTIYNVKESTLWVSSRMLVSLPSVERTQEVVSLRTDSSSQSEWSGRYRGPNELFKARHTAS